MDTRVSLIVLAIVFEMVAILTDLFSDGSEYRKSIIRKTWIICIGCVAGGFVGYLIGTSSLLTFGDVFGRGASFQGVQLLLRLPLGLSPGSCLHRLEQVVYSVSSSIKLSNVTLPHAKPARP